MNLPETLSIKQNETVIMELRLSIETIKLIDLYDNNKSNGLEKIINFLFYRSYLVNNIDSDFIDNDDEQEIFNEILKLLEKKCDLTIGEYNQLINKYYEILINNYEYCKNMIIVLACNGGVDNKVKDYLIENFYQDFLIIDNFFNYRNYFRSNHIVLESWLDKIINSGLYFTSNTITDIIKIIMEFKFDNIAKNFCHNVTEDLNRRISNELLNNEDDKIIFLQKDFYYRWMNFLESEKMTEIFRFKKIEKKVMNKFNIVIKKYGHTFKKEFDATILMEFLKNDIPDNGLVLIEYFNPRLLNNLKEHEKDSILDIFNQGRLSYFNREQKLYLEDIIFNLSVVTNYCIFEETDNLVKSLKSYVNYIDMEYSVDDDFKLINDYKVLFDMYFEISKVEQVSKNVTEDFGNEMQVSRYYGPTMYVCGLIEKTLRNYYIFQRKDIDFEDTKNLKLNDLLSNKRKEIVDLLGEYQIKVLRYFLLNDSKFGGLNIRNKLAHLDYNFHNYNIRNTFINVNVLLMYLVSSIVIKEIN